MDLTLALSSFFWALLLYLVLQSCSKILDLCKRSGIRKAFCVYDCVDEHHVYEKDAVHDTKDGMITKVSNCRIATYNPSANGQEFPREDQMPIDNVQQCHVQLETPQGLVSRFDPSSPLGAPMFTQQNLASCQVQRMNSAYPFVINFSIVSSTFLVTRSNAITCNCQVVIAIPEKIVRYRVSSTMQIQNVIEF